MDVWFVMMVIIDKTKCVHYVMKIVKHVEIVENVKVVMKILFYKMEDVSD